MRMVDEYKGRERRILLRRFFYDDRRLYRLGKAAGLSWFNGLDYRFGRDEFAYMAMEEKREAMDNLSNPSMLSDRDFISALNRVGPPKYMVIDRFVGRYYYFDSRGEGIFKLENRQDEVRRDVLGALEDTKGRAYYFLKAIIKLYYEGRWDRAYMGATWIDILGKIREMGGAYPAPRDLAIIKSYRIYYKTGSRRYPTHTVPEEMISIVDEVLDGWEEG